MITYTNQTTAIKLSFPWGWDPATLTDVELTIDDLAGNTIQTATSAALYTATTLDADADQFARSIVLDAGAGALSIGDRIRIVGINGYEDHIVRGFDNSTKTVILEQILQRDFEDGAAVYRLSAVATVDFSDADDYPPGIQLRLIWTPTGSGDVLTERAEIEASLQIDLAAFADDFEALYPRAYSALKSPADRFGKILRLAQDELRLILSSRGLDIARVVDQRLLTPPLMSLVARYWTLNGDDKLEDERKVIDASYSAAVENLCNLPLWADSDGDGIQDDGEVQDYPHIFERTW